MNEEDKQRFARYRPGYIEPPPTQEDEKSNNAKDKLGFVEKINIDPNDLINQVINEMKDNIKLTPLKPVSLTP
jgi:hypothetical protein